MLKSNTDYGNNWTNQKITPKDMKQHLATNPQFIQSLRNHSTGVDAFNKYQQAVERRRGMDHGKAAAVRKVMT
jgi:hypothetical protein